MTSSSPHIMQIGFGFAELENAREFETIGECKTTPDCSNSAFLFLFCYEFFFLVKLYGEYRMWQL